MKPTKGTKPKTKPLTMKALNEKINVVARESDLGLKELSTNISDNEFSIEDVKNKIIAVEIAAKLFNKSKSILYSIVFAQAMVTMLICFKIF